MDRFEKILENMLMEQRKFEEKIEQIMFAENILGLGQQAGADVGDDEEEEDDDDDEEEEEEDDDDGEDSTSDDEGDDKKQGFQFPILDKIIKELVRERRKLDKRIADREKRQRQRLFIRWAVGDRKQLEDLPQPVNVLRQRRRPISSQMIDNLQFLELCHPSIVAIYGVCHPDIKPQNLSEEDGEEGYLVQRVKQPTEVAEDGDMKAVNEVHYTMEDTQSVSVPLDSATSKIQQFQKAFAELESHRTVTLNMKWQELEAHFLIRGIPYSSFI